MMILSILPPWAINLTICALTAVLTQVASNTATANVLLPILAEMAITICVNPIYLIMSAALTASYAFMLPVKIQKFKMLSFESYMKKRDQSFFNPELQHFLIF